VYNNKDECRMNVQGGCLLLPSPRIHPHPLPRAPPAFSLWHSGFCSHVPPCLDPEVLAVVQWHQQAVASPYERPHLDPLRKLAPGTLLRATYAIKHLPSQVDDLARSFLAGLYQNGADGPAVIGGGL